ncbi:hypothetical protein GP2_065_00040 [Gordonia paraffinivorans NBRC 108238]|uniref:Integral membrane protein n=1 Tax=Gordonia paraffinivorans NBRC 108238 TaxID=1223543 RepID=A0ABQ0IRP4_9ACTN|nr:hypothetical protein [Gordonia paraffinivorans]GAC86239.1 hypothetical protein GP2_065_00040 [Gordonia paraffinivorans NBRC 108238]
MTAALLTFAGSLLIAGVGGIFSRLDANDRHQKLAQKVDILAKLPSGTAAHARMESIVLDAIGDLGEYEHRRRSLMFQRRALMAAFVAWLVVVAIHVTDEKYDLGHDDNILDYVEIIALVVGFLLLIASVAATIRDLRHRHGDPEAPGSVKRPTSG